MPLISAFFGSVGRVHATFAALLMADAHCIADEPVTFLRITLPGEPQLPPRTITEEGLTVLQREARDVRRACETVLEHATTATTAHNLVLDLPAACLGPQSLRERIDAPVVPVGPTPLHEHVAAATLAGMESARADGREPAPPWLLGCDRSGGAAAADAFARTMRSHDGLVPGRGRVRALPTVVPVFSRGEIERLLDGDRSMRSLTASLSLLAALRVVAADPHVVAVETAAFAAALGVDADRARAPDEREAGERLRDLADELQGIRDFVKPTSADLHGAPRLERWRAATRQVRVLTGEVHGHPSFPDGRRITTSDLYASDGTTWARTLSRYFALGKPERDAGRLDRH